MQNEQNALPHVLPWAEPPHCSMILPIKSQSKIVSETHSISKQVHNTLIIHILLSVLESIFLWYFQYFSSIPNAQQNHHDVQSLILSGKTMYISIPNALWKY